MLTRRVLAAAALAALAGAVLAEAPDDMGKAPGAGKRVTITYENLTAGQVLSPSVFISHNKAAPALFVPGKPAPFSTMRIAEEGNAGPFLSAVVTKTFGGAFGSAAQGIAVQPGMSRTVELEVTREFPLISGIFMLVMTNDGFTGVSGVDAYRLTRPQTIDLMAWDAGTERNNERGDYLIAMEGTERDPENGVVTRHTGIRGDADAPGAWKFDPAKPVARITIAPAGQMTSNNRRAP
jgi:hypothetical protein